MIILEWLDENLDLQGIGVAFAMLGVIGSAIFCYLLGA